MNPYELKRKLRIKEYEIKFVWLKANFEKYPLVILVKATCDVPQDLGGHATSQSLVRWSPELRFSICSALLCLICLRHVSVEFSMSTFLIMCQANFSCLFLILKISEFFISIFLKTTSLLTRSINDIFLAPL